MEKLNVKEIIKAVLFVNGEGVSKDDLIEKLELEKKDFEKAVRQLKEEMFGEAGIHLIEFKNKIQLASNPNYSEYISNVLNPIREKALTRAALETLAIIAYKQPITKSEAEEIRGVNCDYSFQLLSDHKMIEVIGRKDAVGKPLVFATTDEFLKRFNLKDIDSLPNYEALLERIKVIEDQPKSDSLYNDFKLPDEEEVPDFLRGEEDLQTFAGVDEVLSRLSEEESTDVDNLA